MVKLVMTILNRKTYFSVLLQGICDVDGNFRDVFIGIPGRVHDARMFRMSPFYQNINNKLGNRWKLLGDSAYISLDFTSVLTPKRDNGTLTRRELAANTALSRGRVIIEKYFR